jgi:hypothetical protein
MDPGGTVLQPGRYQRRHLAMTTQIPYDPGPAQPMPHGPGAAQPMPHGPGAAQPMPYGPGAAQPMPYGPGAGQPTPYGPGAAQPTPYGPGPAQPMPQYPAEPPWAPPPAEAAAPGAPWAGTPHTRHGQLMVPYPELMHGAGRPDPPTWLPVALVTLFLALAGGIGAAAVATDRLGLVGGVLIGAGGGSLGLLGAVSAKRRAKRARRDGNPRYPYWLAFALTLVVAAVPGLYAVGVTAGVVQGQVVEPRVERTVENSLVHGGRLTVPEGVTVLSAECAPTGARSTTDGLRDYTCSVGLSSGRTGSVRLRADHKGNWTAIAAK